MVKRVLLLLVLGIAGCDQENLRLHREADIPWESLRGQWLFINYWAEWCKPCLEELPELTAFDGLHPGARVLGVNYDAVSEVELDRLKQRFAIGFSLLRSDPSPQLRFARPKVLPATVVFNADGQYIDTLYGPQTRNSLQQLMPE